MIKLRHDIFITLVVTMSLVTAKARYDAPKLLLRDGSPEVFDFQFRGNPMNILRSGNQEISTVLRDSPKPIFQMGNPAAAAMHHDNQKSALYAGITEIAPESKHVIPIGNPAVAAMLRDNSRNMFRGENPKISAISNDNLKPNLYTDSLNLLAVLREDPKLLNESAQLRLRKHSQSASHMFPSGQNKYIIKDNDLKETFNKMIETLANDNNERIMNIKKSIALENPQHQVSRTSQQKDPLLAIIMSVPKYKSINHLTENQQYVIVKKKHSVPSVQNIWKETIEGSFNHIEDDDDISQDSAEDRFTKDYYLRGWKGCYKSAAKACEKACKSAIHEVCDEYMCEKKMKKEGKSQCKKKCKSEFSSDKDRKKQ